MSKKTIVVSAIVLIIVVGAGYLFAVQPMTQSELVKYKLANGTPEEKETVLADFMSMLEKSGVATITPYIPAIIESILDGTPLPRHEDTGWGNVYHFAATIMNKLAYKIDGVQRDQDPKFSFYDSVGTADGMTRKSVHDNWLKWWKDHYGANGIIK